MQTQVSAPADQPVPVTMAYPPVTAVLPELNGSAMFIIGVIAIVGLIGLFAVIGSSGKCKC